MKKNLVILGILSLMLLVLCFPVPALAEIEFHIKPDISIKYGTESNYYKSEGGKRPVQEMSISPGFGLRYKKSKTLVTLDYTLNADFFKDMHEIPLGERPASDDNYLGHDLSLRAGTELSDRVTVGLKESFTLTRDPAQSDEFSDAVDRDKYWINRITPEITYQFAPRFKVDLRYRNTLTHYAKTTREDSIEHRGILDFGYAFTQTRYLDLEYQHWRRNYDQTTSGYTSDQITLIFRKEYRYFNIRVGGGYQKRDFDDSALEDISLFTYYLKFDGLNLLERRRSYVTFDVEHDINDQSVGDNYFQAYRFTLRGGHAFTRKTSVKINAYYQIANYENTTGLTSSEATALRKDHTLNISATVKHSFARWVALSLTAGQERRNSNLKGDSYVDNYWSVQADFKLSEFARYAK